MYETEQKCRLEFRCRPVRSNSCSTNSKVNLGTKMVEQVGKGVPILKKKMSSGIGELRGNQACNREENRKANISVGFGQKTSDIKQQCHKTQTIFQIPKKVLKLQPRNPPPGSTLFPRFNSRRQARQISSLESNCSQVDSSPSRSEGDGEMQQEGHHDFWSKATMKNKRKGNQSKEIKSMLMELADGHQEMMAMLRQIMKEKKEKPKQQEKFSKIRCISLNNPIDSTPRCLHNPDPNLKIHKIYNEAISCSTTPIKTDMLHQSALTLRSTKIPSYVASMLVQVLNSNFSYNSLLNSQMQVRELISRRFQAFFYNYNYFLECLLELGKKWMEVEELRSMLMTVPFLLAEEQVEVVIGAVLVRGQHGCEANNGGSLVLVSQLAEKMRYFIQNRQPISLNLIRLKIPQFKTIFTTKRSQIEQKFQILAQYQDHINILTMQKILKQFRLQDMEIEILLSKLCVVAKNVAEMPYGVLFEMKWIQGLGQEV